RSPGKEQLIEKLISFSSPKDLAAYIRSHRAALNGEIVAALKTRIDRAIRVDAHQATRMADVTLQVLRVVKDPPAQALGFRAKAQVLHVVGFYERARRFYDRALHLYQALGRELEAAK